MLTVENATKFLTKLGLADIVVDILVIKFAFQVVVLQGSVNVTIKD